MRSRFSRCRSRASTAGYHGGHLGHRGLDASERLQQTSYGWTGWPVTGIRVSGCLLGELEMVLFFGVRDFGVDLAPARAANHGAEDVAGRAAGGHRVTSELHFGHVASAADAGVGHGDRRAGTRGGDPGPGVRRGGCFGGATAQAGGVVPLRDGGQGEAAAATLGLTPIGDAAGHVDAAAHYNESVAPSS